MCSDGSAYGIELGTGSATVISSAHAVVPTDPIGIRAPLLFRSGFDAGRGGGAVTPPLWYGIPYFPLVPARAKPLPARLSPFS